MRQAGASSENAIQEQLGNHLMTLHLLNVDFTWTQCDTPQQTRIAGAQPELPVAKTWNTIPWKSIRLPEPTCHLILIFIESFLKIWEYENILSATFLNIRLPNTL